MYNGGKSLSGLIFWRYSVLTAVVGGAVAFFIPYYTVVASGRDSVDDIYSLGKIVFIIVVAVVCMPPTSEDSTHSVRATPAPRGT